MPTQALDLSRPLEYFPINPNFLQHDTPNLLFTNTYRYLSYFKQRTLPIRNKIT